MQRRYLAILGFLAVLSLVAPARAQDVEFDSWLTSFKEKAAAEGVSARLLDEAFANMEPDEEVVALDRKQPENKITLLRYLKNTLSQRRIDRGREMLQEHKELLTRIGNKYGVQPKYIVALWAIESDFGNNKGSFSVLQSLATLAYEGRRAEFFAGELVAALKIVQMERTAPADLTGSWAGAMGDCQFMPSTYLRFAVDGDGDGRRDIWNSEADIFASIANYLHSLDWNPQQDWGHKVTLPDDFSDAEADLKQGKLARQWHKRGLRYTNGHALKGNAVLFAVYPGAAEDGAYLVSTNFQALLQWNRSRYFATAVGTLADAIGDGNEL